MNIFEKRKIEEQIERDLRDARLQKSKDRRIERELKKTQSTGNVSSFLKKEADSNEILKSTLATIDPSFQFQQASVEYQKSLTTTSTISPLDQRVQQNQPSPETVLPPRPDDNLIYSLTVEDTELKWLPYGEGGGSACIGLVLYTKTIETSQQVWISAGTVAGELPSGFDPTDGKNIANAGSGNVWAEVNIDGQTGEIVSIDVEKGTSTPENTDTAFYYTLGYYEYDSGTPNITNYGCGGIEVRICRNWFAAESPFYGVTLTRCGCGGY
jgi:hypothetical protein